MTRFPAEFISPAVHPIGLHYIMTVGAPIPIGILLNSQTIQLYSVYCITMRQAMALCYTTLLNGVINRSCA